MRCPAIDLAARRALRREVSALVDEHPDLVSDAETDRCAAWLAGEPPDAEVEPDTRDSIERPVSAGRRDARTASRGE